MVITVHGRNMPILIMPKTVICQFSNYGVLHCEGGWMGLQISINNTVVLYIQFIDKLSYVTKGNRPYDQCDHCQYRSQLLPNLHWKLEMLQAWCVHRLYCDFYRVRFDCDMFPSLNGEGCSKFDIDCRYPDKISQDLIPRTVGVVQPIISIAASE